MREIKFKAWNTVIGGWADDNHSTLHDLVMSNNSRISKKMLEDDFTFLQFTGRRADNDAIGGEDIYEGDYLIALFRDEEGCDVHMEGEVIYEDCRFILYSTEYNQSLWLGSSAITKLIIIGNKFENEGLLNET